MATKTNNRYVKEAIRSISWNDSHPIEMKVDSENRIYYIQKKLKYQYQDKNGNIVEANNLRLNLYFDPLKKCTELLDIDIDIMNQEEEIRRIIIDKEIVYNQSILKDRFKYFSLQFSDKFLLLSYKHKDNNNKSTNNNLDNYIKDKTIINDIAELENNYSDYIMEYKTVSVLENYFRNKKYISDINKSTGFFANTTLNLDIDPIEASNIYSIRDEQEKYFSRMKGIMGSDRSRCSSYTSKEGRLFLLFVAQIIGSYISYIRKEKLYKDFHSIKEILEEMRSIKKIEYEDGTSIITPFVGKQLDIASAFGFEIPEGCLPESLKTKTSKNGQKKNRIEISNS